MLLKNHFIIKIEKLNFTYIYYKSLYSYDNRSANAFENKLSSVLRLPSNKNHSCRSRNNADWRFQGGLATCKIRFR